MRAIVLSRDLYPVTLYPIYISSSYFKNGEQRLFEGELLRRIKKQLRSLLMDRTMENFYFYLQDLECAEKKS